MPDAARPETVVFPCIRGNVYTPPMGTEEAVFGDGMTDSDNAVREATVKSVERSGR